MNKWTFETRDARGETHYDVTLDWDRLGLIVRIYDTLFPEENIIRLYDLDGIKKLRQILTEIENSLKEN